MEFDEGGKDIYGHERFAGIANQLSVELEERLGKEARPVILGHVQRGGTPDRVRPGARHPLRLARGGGRAPRASSA